jgi:hypothetical protein
VNFTVKVYRLFFILFCFLEVPFVHGVEYICEKNGGETKCVDHEVREWNYSICDPSGNFLWKTNIMCRVHGGERIGEACIGGVPPTQSTYKLFAKNYINEINSIVGAPLISDLSDSGWGYSGMTCWNAGPIYFQGILQVDYKVLGDSIYVKRSRDIECPEGSSSARSAITNEVICKVNECLPPTIYNEESGYCEERCPVGSKSKDCMYPPEEQSCKTLSNNPINFLNGQKWLREVIYSSVYPVGIEIYYHYNNHGNSKFSAYGYRPQFISGTYVYRRYRPAARPLVNQYYIKPTYSQINNQQLKAIATHWKHSYDYTLVKTDSGFTLFTPNGSYTQFNASGRSVQYPSQKLSEINNGYALSKGTQSFTFNSDGQLIELKEPNRVIEVTYADQQQTLTLKKNNQLIETVTIDYDTEHRTTRFTFETGHVELEWAASLTSLTYFDSSGNQYKKRSFNYDDERFPESVTSIDDDYGSGPEQYAYFEYNSEGKAVMSSLAGDVDRLEVEYPTNYQRIVTNSQGYQKKYFLTENDQFRKLARVEGEATVSCEPSSAEYQYDNDGNLIQSIVNGLTTQYEYENGFETKRIEGADTESQRIVEIERNNEGLPYLIKDSSNTSIIYSDGLPQIIEERQR